MITQSLPVNDLLGSHCWQGGWHRVHIGTFVDPQSAEESADRHLPLTDGQLLATYTGAVILGERYPEAQRRGYPTEHELELNHVVCSYRHLHQINRGAGSKELWASVRFAFDIGEYLDYTLTFHPRFLTRLVNDGAPALAITNIIGIDIGLVNKQGKELPNLHLKPHTT